MNIPYLSRWTESSKKEFDCPGSPPQESHWEEVDSHGGPDGLCQTVTCYLATFILSQKKKSHTLP